MMCDVMFDVMLDGRCYLNSLSINCSTYNIYIHRSDERNLTLCSLNDAWLYVIFVRIGVVNIYTYARMIFHRIIY